MIMNLMVLSNLLAPCLDFLEAPFSAVVKKLVGSVKTLL